MADGASTNALLAAPFLALVAQAGALHFFGQPFICACGSPFGERRLTSPSRRRFAVPRALG
jgi:hypothetical protein